VQSAAGHGECTEEGNAGKVKELVMRTSLHTVIAAAAVALLTGGTCAQAQGDATGPQPTLPQPSKSLVPTVNIAPAKGWPADAKPTAARGTHVEAYARDLQHPRWVHVLPNGDVLVAESSAPPKPADAPKGV
jgi:glucose/arabinose dehydrogenase